MMSYEYNTTTGLLSIVSLLVSIENGLAQLSKVEDLCEQRAVSKRGLMKADEVETIGKNLSGSEQLRQ